jgi:hypothetical protein
MRGALMGAMMMMATMPVIAAPNVTPVPVINDALAMAEIEIAPIVIQAPATYTHAIVTDVALDVIEIFAI